MPGWCISLCVSVGREACCAEWSSSFGKKREIRDQTVISPFLHILLISAPTMGYSLGFGRSRKDQNSAKQYKTMHKRDRNPFKTGLNQDNPGIVSQAGRGGSGP